MAGSYPDVPGYRFAYDVDGTTLAQYTLPSGTGTNQSGSILTILNNENTTESADTTFLGLHHLAFLFPEKRNISGIVTSLADRWIGSGTLDWSTDTTNGLDGTWMSLAQLSAISLSGVPASYLRTNIVPLNLTDAVSIRFSNVDIAFNSRFSCIHIYGSIAPSESPDRLRIVDLTSSSTTSDNITPAGDDIIAQLDFGNIKQRASSTKQFKIVNNSTAKTANSITAGLNAPSDASPSLIGQYQISTDNVAFANAVNIGSLAPGASSGTLYLRNNVAANAQLSVWSARIIAHPVSWS